MNGNTPTTAQAPPSVQRARQARPGKRGWTGLWGGRILGALIALTVLAMVGVKVASTWQTRTPKATTTESTMDPYWGRQTFQYKAEEPAVPPTPTPPTDTLTPELAALRRQLAAIQQEVEALKNRKTPAAATTEKGSGRQAAAPRAMPAPTQVIAHDIGKDKDTTGPTAGAYVLAPSTYLPCSTETRIVSDVEGYFVAVVNQNVYDTATHRHLLVPQGSRILGNDQANDLVYGSNRMDTVSLTLTLPDGRSVDLGRAPVTDQQGVAGLTGDVNNHYLKLFGAVFIGGALKGGMSALQVAMADAAGAGQVTAGITSLGNQATQTRVQPYINIRPTITVEAGQLCTVILTKPLHLPAMWQ